MYPESASHIRPPDRRNLSCLCSESSVFMFPLPATARCWSKTGADGQTCDSKTKSNQVDVTDIMNSLHNRGTRGKSGNITKD